jgi:nitroreductase
MLAGLVGVIALAGCGGSSPKPDPARLVRLVAETNDLCHRESQHPSQLIRFRSTLLKELENAAEYLPAGRRFNEALTARHALEREASKAERENRRGFVSGSFLQRVYRARTRLYYAAKALGLTACLGSPPQRPISG